MAKVNPLDVLAVKNVISRYCEALDTKDFALLERVFTQDVVADYPFNSALQGVGAVAKAIQNRYRNLWCAHLLHCLIVLQAGPSQNPPQSYNAENNLRRNG